MEENKLFDEFNSTSFEDWKNLAEKDLKGKDFEKSLVWKTYEGFKVNPLYTEQDISGLGYISDSFVNALGKDLVNNSWSICEEISVPNIKEANRIAKDSLHRGANSIAFRCEYNPSSINGIAIHSKEDFSKLINSIDIEKTPINFFPGIAGPQALSLLASYCNSNNLNLKKIKGCIFYSPLNELVLEGKFHQDEKEIFNNLGLIVSYLDRNMPNYKALAVDGTNFREAGSSLVQELAFSFSIAVEYLEKLLEENLKIDSILNSAFFSFSIGSNYFMEIAKLRAARIVWSKIAEQYNPKKKKSTITTIYCRTLNWNKTIYDPQVNMLRTTLESMAGAIGGCDYIAAMPYNCLYAINNEFSRRIARNTQIILNEESYLDKVVDIAAGSYYIENLTDTIANETLKLFQEVESKGGFIECLKNSFIQNSIEKVQQSKKTNSEFRKEVFLGTNQYPNLSESVLKNFEEIDIKTKISQSDTIANTDFESIEELIELSNTPDFRIANFLSDFNYNSDLNIEPIALIRGAENFEQIRLATEKHFIKTGSRPKVFLFTIGNLNARRARAAFATNFFGCAGYEIIDNVGFKTVDEGVEMSINSEAEIVVICSSDDEYKELVPEISAKIRDNIKNTALIVAGYPAEIVEDLKQVGIDDFIFLKSNTFEILTKYQERLGVMNS